MQIEKDNSRPGSGGLSRTRQLVQRKIRAVRQELSALETTAAQLQRLAIEAQDKRSSGVSTRSQFPTKRAESGSWRAAIQAAGSGGREFSARDVHELVNKVRAVSERNARVQLSKAKRALLVEQVGPRRYKLTD